VLSDRRATAELPDHGELWSRPWRVDDHGPDRLTLSLRVPRGPYRFRRALRLAPAAARLELDYAVENEGERPLDFTWCLHALCALEAGMQLELPDGAALRVPDPREAGFAPRATKRFYGPLERGRVALRAATGRESLRISFDPAQIPFLGLWLNFGGWSGAGGAPYWNAGLEPSIGDADSLDDACARGTAARLEPGARRSWRVAIELGP